MKSNTIAKTVGMVAVVGMIAAGTLNVPHPQVAQADVTSSMKETVKDTVKQAGDKGMDFKDLSGHWAQAAINLAVKNGYVDGYPDGTFIPDGKVTRAEFIKMVDAALKLPVTGTGSGNDWYIPYINAAVNAGLHNWSDFTTGDWNTAMTRKEMARIAVRAANGDKNTDDRKWMYLATKAGLINGLDDTGTLGEDQTTTRAQSVTIIERILSIKGGETLPSDKHAVSRAEVSWHGTNIYTMWPRYFPARSIDRFDISKGKWDSPDGIYHEQLIQYVVVDMEDPNDPFKQETDGMKFRFDKFDSTGNFISSEVISAPLKSYISYSKVKQTLSGQYPKGWYASEGGYATVRDIGPSNNNNEWKSKYSNQETPDNILFSKLQVLQNIIDVNISRGYNPYDPTYLKSNVDYYWINAMLHPKGDMFGRISSFSLNYLPNLYYFNNGGGKPSSGNRSTEIVTSIPDYNVHNQ